MAQEDPAPLTHPLPPASPAQQEAPNASEHISASVQSFDDAARQLIGVEGVLAGLYFNAFTFGKINSSLSLQLLVYLLPLAMVFISVISAFGVFFPSGYLSIDQATGLHRITILDLAQHKSRWFRVASIFFILSIAGFFFALMQYLLR